MLRIRNIATTVALCALSIGAAAPAVAAPVLSGHYIKEETDANGRHATTNLYFTPVAMDAPMNKTADRLTSIRANG